MYEELEWLTTSVKMIDWLFTVFAIPFIMVMGFIVWLMIKEWRILGQQEDYRND